MTLVTDPFVRIAVIPPVPVTSMRREVLEPAGDWTLADVAAATGLPEDSLSISVDGVIVERDRWAATVPAPGASIVVGTRPGGFFFSIPLIGLELTGAYAAAAIVITAAATIYGGYKLQQMLAPDPINPDALGPGTRATIAGSRNSFNPYAPVPQVLGRHKLFPPLAARSYTTVEDGKLYQYALMTAGYGKLAISDVKIGDDPVFKTTTAITYTGIMSADTDQFKAGQAAEEAVLQFEFRQGTNSDAAITLFSADVQEQIIGLPLRKSKGWTVRRTETGARRITVIVSAANGLMYRTRSGDVEGARVDCRVEYRAANSTGPWLAAGSQKGLLRVSDKTQNSVHRSITFDVAEGTYDVRVRRETDDSTDPLVIDQVEWASMLVNRAGEPVAEDGLCLIAMKARITGNFTRVIDQMNAVFQTVVPDYESGSWVTQATSNPASLYRHVLQGAANKRAVADSRINLTKLASWHAECESAGLEFNFVTQGQTTVSDLLASIAKAGRASPAVQDGLFTVVTENALSGAPVQHFTPRNVTSFAENRVFETKPHALKVQFVDPAAGWLDTERIVPDDGYTTTTATTFRRLDIAGVTSSDQAYKLGRYYIAKARLRPSQYVIETDFEHLDCVRGDWVKLNHDVILIGLAAGRVTGLVMNGSDLSGVTVDQQCPMQAGTYGIRFRKSDGTTVVCTVTTAAGYQTTLDFTADITSGNPMPAVGDLFLFGTSGSESIDCVVAEIEPLDELRARVTLVDAATGVLSASTGTIPAYSSQVTIPPAVNPARLTRPRVTSVTSGNVRDRSGTATNARRGVRIQIGRSGVRVLS